MPSQLPSSFASAAAGNRDSRGPWNESNRGGSGSGEWPRPNGTRTFRRPSATPANMNAVTNLTDHVPAMIQDAGPTSAHPLQPMTDTSQPPRYSKHELLEVLRAPLGPAVNVTNLFMPGWNPGHVNGNSSRAWGKMGESMHHPQDATVCWDADGHVGLLCLEELTLQEQELFACDVNSTVKNAQQNKDSLHQGGGGGPNGRKLSVSVGPSGGNYALSSPTASASASRPGTRRRETGDTNPFAGGGLTSPTGTGRFSRDDGSSWFARRSAESKDSTCDEGDEAASSAKTSHSQPFGSARNPSSTATATATSTAGFGGTSGLWVAAPSTSTGGGAFGNFSISGHRPMGVGVGVGVGTGAGRGESRLAHLIPGNNEVATAESSRSWRARQRADTDPFGGAHDTSPKSSPVVAREDGGDESAVEHTLPRTFGTGTGAAGFEGSDRSQTSSAGAKGYPNLGGLGGLTGWPVSNPFGTNIFNNPVGDMQPQSSSSLAFSAQSAATRGSKLGSLFPPAMQAQMQSHEQDSLGGPAPVPDLRQGQANPLGAIGRVSVGQPRDTRPALEDILQSSTADSMAASAQSFTPAIGTSSQVAADPNAPTKIMVMPDRMRWVYLDPQGHVQGPFSGLEMNDWYKANFFSPDLRVKKLEDGDFEPLGQLIRRIGNSREPFLVPQMGIPHGPPSNGPFGVVDTRGGVVPPLQNAFPTFGRTLTAEEQNNLERRKQEEQILMARQREFLAQQQALMKMSLQTPGLQHHSSMHSLQSQPSFGSITSPMGTLGQTSGFFDAAISMSQPTHPDMFSSDLSGPERQMLASMQAAGNLSTAFPSASAEGSMRNQVPFLDPLQGEYGNPRLQEFLELRGHRDSEAESAEARASSSHAAGRFQMQTQTQEATELVKEVMDLAASDEAGMQQPLSLTQQVRKAQADAAAGSSGFPMPFPPPQTSTPLPAPTAQRAKSNLPSQYDSRSGSDTPETASDSAPVAAPPTAPWAGTETRRGPSLKEIQEAEAQKAAKQEEAALAARRAALDAEAVALREREREKLAAAPSVLPSTSTWGTGSPVGAPAPGSAWASRPAVKATPAPESASKKTLADIQREEETRKQRQQQLAMQAGAHAGKRYADLASNKSSGPPGITAPSLGGWTTVGASGRVRAPPTGPAATRTTSAPAAKSAPASKPVSKPAAAPKDNSSAALEEFNKWLRRELTRGLDKLDASDIESFAATLIVLPLDPVIIADSVYANSTTMDGRHFGDEFVRRKKLADRGVVEKQPIASDVKNGGNGGWNEVAKKGNNAGNTSTTQKDDAASLSTGGQYKIVSGRKKGKK